ncbi:Hypothetical Protein FCC1311_089932 [Hondaea fermentalgiana]|uniref:AB hydrolase-1 domain-containing protein n=1 Tax=Hondaea fermentalgiana TaxID=2315210 RepID=A0A2R5GSN3_9STRA|nr:Hypothetical Protein FCC1311_089932 [Hondaea fermentalgiana]|eukprot:GBG32768.1 Hypothetical Protein FCC1311_089932 [Hondaea fermentalgiana]
MAPKAAQRPSGKASAAAAAPAAQVTRVKDGSEAGELQGDEVMRALQGNALLAKTVMALCKSVAPVSAAALFFKLVSYLSGHHKHFLVHPVSRMTTLMNLYMVAETAFGVYCAHARAQGQALAQSSTLTKEERIALFEKCLATVDDHEAFATSWLRDADASKVRRGNIENWLAWSFFNMRYQHLSQDERDEVEEYCKIYERVTGSPLKGGHNGLIRAYRFSIEPVQSAHRPLAYYLIVHGLLQRVLAPIGYAALGFSGLRSQGSFKYYIRRARIASTEPPIVLLHGIGIGPLPYLRFAKGVLAQVGDSRDVVVLELGAISQQVAPAPLLPERFVEDLRAMCTREALAPARFVGHSYGTMVMAWIVKSAPELAESYAFLDPGCFLLHYTKALKAIIYKHAVSDGEKIFEYFLRSELFFSNHMRRHFFWFKNVLFFEDIPQHQKALIILSDRDDIMPVKEVVRAFDEHPRRGEALQHIRILRLPNLTHGSFLFAEECQQVIDSVVSFDRVPSHV